MVALNLSTILAANNTTFLSSSNYTATAGQVKFAANYTVGYVEVYQNGLRLADSDFTAANGEHVILTSAASVSDNIDIVAHKATNISGAALPTTNMIAGTGLTGGGTLAADRTFNLATNIATANLTATGTVTLTSATPTLSVGSAAISTGTAKIEVGTGRTGDGGSYIDLVSDATYTDYGLRLIRNAGAAGAGTLYHRGTGGMYHYNTDASPMIFSTTAAERMRIAAAGDVTVEETLVVKKGVPVRTAGGNNVTLALTDNGKLIYCVNTASAMNIHIPNNSSVAFPVGAEMSFLQHLTHASANTLGFSNAAGVILHSKEAANTVADRFTTAVLKKLATNTWVLAGSLS